MKTHFVSLLGCALFLAGCGGGGGPPPEPPDPKTHELKGNWLGVAQEIDLVNSTTETYDIQITINDKGKLTAFVAEGQSEGTGEVALVSPQIYLFRLSNNNNGVFYVDSTRTYILFVSTDGSSGVLQRGATGLPSHYYVGDIQGNWSGNSLFVDRHWGYKDVKNSSAEFQSSRTFQITEDGVVFGTAKPILGGNDGKVVLLDPAMGLYACWAEIKNERRVALLLISPDKEFLGGIFCPFDSANRIYGYPNMGSFIAWTKQ